MKAFLVWRKKKEEKIMNRRKNTICTALTILAIIAIGIYAFSSPVAMLRVVVAVTVTIVYRLSKDRSEEGDNHRDHT